MPSIDRRMDAARDVMAGAGFTETWNPALVSGRKLEALRVAAMAMRVSNALSDDMDTLRTSLLPSLVDAVALNRDRGRDEVCVYEIAPVFLARIGEKDSQPEEPLRLAAVATAGTTAESSAAAFYRLKSVLDGCIAELSTPACTYHRRAAGLFHPVRGAT